MRKYVSRMFFFCLADPSLFESEFDSAGVNELEERGSVVDKEDEEEDEEEEEEEEGDEEEENPSPLIPK